MNMRTSLTVEFLKDTPLKTNEYPLKIDGWNLKCPFKTVPFLGTFVHFRGVETGHSFFLGKLSLPSSMEPQLVT